MNNKLIINYCKGAMPMSDFECEEYVEVSYNMLKDKTKDIIINISSELLITVARGMIVQGRLDSERVLFAHENDIIGYADKNGRLTNWPKGFCDTYDHWLNIICFKIKVEDSELSR